MIFKRALIHSNIDDDMTLLVNAYELPDKLVLTD